MIGVRVVAFSIFCLDFAIGLGMISYQTQKHAPSPLPPTLPSSSASSSSSSSTKTTN